MPFSKVITHDTSFHADEVVAVALLKFAGFDFEVVRTRDAQILEKAVVDPHIMVLDVGGQYDPANLNFDHHQDMNLLSAAGLVYQFFKDKILDEESQPFFDRFISAIDMIDTNRDNIFGIWATLPRGFRNVSSLIGGFNREVTDPVAQNEQFNKAVAFALQIIENEVFSAAKKARSEAEYATRQILDNHVAVFEQFSTVWKDKKEHLFAILPHANGWQIQSLDTTIATVPESVSACEGFVFRHASGFMAVVKDKDALLTFVGQLDGRVPETNTEA